MWDVCVGQDFFGVKKKKREKRKEKVLDFGSFMEITNELSLMKNNFVYKLFHEIEILSVYLEKLATG